MMQKLQYVGLCVNQIGDHGARYIAAALATHPVSMTPSSSFSFYFSTQTLTSINLYHNQIGDVSAEYFADALRTNTVNVIICLFLSFLAICLNI